MTEPVTNGPNAAVGDAEHWGSSTGADDADESVEEEDYGSVEEPASTPYLVPTPHPARPDDK